MGIKIIAQHKRARFDYQIIDTLEAGIMLAGTEVKSLRDGKASMSESFVMIDKNNEVWVHNLSIPHYSFGNINNHDERRKRKLLVNKSEAEKFAHRVKAEGLTIIALKLYFKNRYVKLEIALGKGKKLHDKRADTAKKDVERKLRQGHYSG